MNIRGQNSPTVAIVGIGAIGGFLATLLWKHGISARCIVREEKKTIFSQKGIRLKSPRFGAIVAHPFIEARLSRSPDFLIITTKSYSLSEALFRISENVLEGTTVVPFLNGIGHVELLRSRFKDTAVAVGVMGGVESYISDSGEIISPSTSPHAEIASGDARVSREKLNVLASLFSDAGIRTTILKNEAEVIWGKLVRLSALAGTTAASGKTIGEIFSDSHWRLILEECVKEAAAVAQCEKVAIHPRMVLDDLGALPETLTTSLARDVEAGRQSELDAILGEIIRRAKKYQLPCNTIEDLYQSIQEKQKSLS